MEAARLTTKSGEVPVVERDRLKELHVITPIVNMESILDLGLLSHSKAASVTHESVASAEVQARRASKRVSGGLLLHDYVNLYFHARNAMMYAKQEMHDELCVLSVSTDVLDLDGTVISDCNAATDYARFAPSPVGLAIVDESLTFAQYWTDPDIIVQERKKRAKQAEVLVADRVDPSHIKGAYVSCRDAEKALAEAVPACKTALKPSLFFRA